MSAKREQAKHPEGWHWFPESNQRHWLDASDNDDHMRRSACGCWRTMPADSTVHLADAEDGADFNCWLCRHELRMRREGRLQNFDETGVRVAIAVSERSGIRGLNGHTGVVERLCDDGRAVVRMDEPFQWPKTMGGDDKLCRTIRLYARQCVREEAKAGAQ